ncbi:MAG: tRNA lysidine(34) synthetase TilS [Betaproteobacteria bacterium]
MASSRKRASANLVVGLSGGVDSVVLLHQLKSRPGVRALHVHHGLSPNADAWAQFCRRLCREWNVPLTVRRVKVKRSGKGLEAAAREARYAVFRSLDADIALAHNLDDQAETVLMNLLRGAGVRGASGMPAAARLGSRRLVRPLLDVSRAEILAYARKNALAWIEDESNADEALTRNFVRRRVGPLLESRFPAWKRSLARAARLFAAKDAARAELLREFLRGRGLKAPSEAKLAEMLKQLSGDGARTLVKHDGARLRVYRGSVLMDRDPAPLASVAWTGQSKLDLPGGELRFERVRGGGIDAKTKPLVVRARRAGARLQPDPRRPRRTLKNLFQEAGVPAWERERIPCVYFGDELVWVPGLGVDARFQARPGRPGVLPEWHPIR